MRQFKITKSITDRRTDSLDKYLQEISKEEMVTPEEEVELAKRIHAGDADAADRLVRANLRFVVSVAKQYQYQNQGLGLQDLINEGNMGLMKAAWKFDETKGFKFISYAVWWIRQSILQALAEQSRTIRLPFNQVNYLTKIARARNEFEQKNCRQATTEELAEMTGLSSDKIIESMVVSENAVSADARFSEDEDGALLDIIPDKDALPADSRVEAESIKIEIGQLLEVLPERARNILKAIYGIGCREMTIDEIGERYGLTRERVRQIREKSLRRLRAPEIVRNLRPYLG